jgi:hypothetical protein
MTSNSRKAFSLLAFAGSNVENVEAAEVAGASLGRRRTAPWEGREWIAVIRWEAQNPAGRAWIRIHQRMQYVRPRNAGSAMRGLIHPQMKTNRAAEHLKRLLSLVGEFRRDGAFTTTAFDFVEPSGRELHVFRIVLNPCSPEVPLAIGEFAYSLRSALDQLAWQLALLSGRMPSRDTAFPIHSTEDSGSEKRFTQLTRDIPAEAIEVIRSLQPYNLANSFREHPLWQLNQLCNLDKHCTMAVNSTSIDVDTGPPGEPTIDIYERELENGKELAVRREFKDQVYFRPKMPEMLFGRPIDEPGPEFEIRESDLIEMHRFVRENVIPSFYRFFPISNSGAP